MSTRACSPALGGSPRIRRPDSAATAFAGVVRPRDGRHRLLIERGFEMGRPSLFAPSLEVEGGALRKATIVGAAVIVSSGALEL